MLSVICFFEDLDVGSDDTNGGAPSSSTSSHSTHSVGNNNSSSSFGSSTNGISADDASKIIERNNQGPETKAVVSIKPSSAAELSQQSANSASSAANRFANQTSNAGQHQSSISRQYVRTPTVTPSRMNTNPIGGMGSL